jgi:hypothetical protein
MINRTTQAAWFAATYGIVASALSGTAPAGFTARQRMMPGNIFPVFVNETAAIQTMVPGAGYLNQVNA